MSDIDPIRTSPVSMENCGAALAMTVVPDRWTWLILRELFYGVARFADIQDDIGIPKSVLSGRLATMVDTGLIQKEAYRDGTARTRHGYVLTQKGRDLVPVIVALMQWGDKHLKDGTATLDLTDRRTGTPVKAGLVLEGGILPARRLAFAPAAHGDN